MDHFIDALNYFKSFFKHWIVGDNFNNLSLDKSPLNLMDPAEIDKNSPTTSPIIESSQSPDPTVDTESRDSDGLRQRIVRGKENGSPVKKVGFFNGLKKHLMPEDSEDENNEEAESETPTPKKEKALPKPKMSFNGSPCHSWISNSSTNPYEGECDEEVDEEYDGGDIDDYEYDPYTHEYVPRIRDPPPGEDSDDGLLVSRQERDRSLSVIAQALLSSARVNQDNFDKQHRESTGSSCRGTRELRNIEDMPPHLQFNKHIHSGYRELHDFWGCVFSLGYMHNETLNVLTHAAPLIYILLYWKTMFPWTEIVGNTFLNILGCAHIAASISPWIGSVIYHLFMSHQKGDRFYQLLLQIDMFGIWITECFGALTNLSAASWCLQKDSQTAIMTAYGLAAVWGLQKALTAWTPLGRRMCFAPVFISRIMAFILRLSSWGGGNPTVLSHVILQDVLSIAGGIVGVVRIPEKWFPGKLDMWFNSHHIMHILVVVAVCHMNMATNGDIRWIIDNYSQSQCTQLN